MQNRTARQPTKRCSTVDKMRAKKIGFTTCVDHRGFPGNEEAMRQRKDSYECTTRWLPVRHARKATVSQPIYQRCIIAQEKLGESSTFGPTRKVPLRMLLLMFSVRRVYSTAAQPTLETWLQLSWTVSRVHDSTNTAAVVELQRRKRLNPT